MTTPDFIRRTLEDLRRRDLWREMRAMASPTSPRIRVGGRELLQFASNNYLGLAGHPRVVEAARRGLDRWGWGAGASRLVAGHTEAHAALEADLAAFKRTDAALVFPTGYQANLAMVAALAGRHDRVVFDRANHASLYDAVTLAGAALERYAHADANAAAELLAAETNGPGRTWVVTDTVFSMDGDRAPLAALAEACDGAGAGLLLDEAHATGVLGPEGAGLAAELAEPARGAVVASVGTLSKALGGVGGFVAASREVIDLLVNRARPFIYTTAIPPAACEAAREALALARAEPDRRERVLALADGLRGRLAERGLDAGRSSTPIVPVILGDPAAALDAAGRLLEAGIFCPAIRPPTVPPGTSRLRVSLTADHTEADVDRLVAALA